MKIYLVWQETLIDGDSSVVGFCKTEDEAYAMCDKLKAGRNRITRFSYWVEELEELV
jgi:hypothetical protein